MNRIPSILFLLVAIPPSGACIDGGPAPMPGPTDAAKGLDDWHSETSWDLECERVEVEADSNLEPVAPTGAVLRESLHLVRTRDRAEVCFSGRFARSFLRPSDDADRANRLAQAALPWATGGTPQLHCDAADSRYFAAWGTLDVCGVPTATGRAVTLELAGREPAYNASCRAGVPGPFFSLLALRWMPRDDSTIELVTVEAATAGPRAVTYRCRD